MSEAAIRSAIYAIVNATTNAGKVYDYDRWANDWSAFLDLFKTTISSVVQIRGWEIAYEGFTESERMQFRNVSNKGGIVRRHRFVINGYMGLDDSATSEKTFAALAESVCNNLDDAETIRRTNYFTAPECTLEIDKLLFGSVLCHHAVITQEVEEYLAS